MSIGSWLLIAVVLSTVALIIVGIVALVMSGSRNKR
jgi:hypothetical protein